MPFQIGSNTKMMIAAVIPHHQEEGPRSLDDPLALHLPEVAARLPFGDSITRRHPADHTSGVVGYTDIAPDGTPGLWGHGGQTPGFLSSVGAFAEAEISHAGWGSSSMNIFALGDMAIVEALKASGALAR